MDKEDAPAEWVIRQYGDMVYRLAYAQVHQAADADDIFQEVFLRYIRKERHFASEEHRKAWLLRVTVNCAKSHYASPWHKRMQPLADAPVPWTEPADLVLAEALAQLAPKYRAVIHLFYYEGYQVAEIAYLLKRRESTVRTQLTRARQKLAHLLEGETRYVAGTISEDV